MQEQGKFYQVFYLIAPLYKFALGNLGMQHNYVAGLSAYFSSLCKK